ncbi:hypothetical protein HK096_011565, partial [Nowakowskiella sp. JEL0078]
PIFEGSKEKHPHRKPAVQRKDLLKARLYDKSHDSAAFNDPANVVLVYTPAPSE